MAGSQDFYTMSGARTTSPQFGIERYSVLVGLASPLVWIIDDQVDFEGVGFFAGSGLTANINEKNGQYGLILQAQKCNFKQCFFAAGPSSTACACIINGAEFGASITGFEDCQWQGSTVFGDVSIPGQSSAGPPIPNLLLHWSDSSGYGPAQIQIYGNCSFSGRGILLDGLNYAASSAEDYNFGETGAIEYQSPCQPSVMAWTGHFFNNFVIANWINDSQQGAMFANWGAFVYNVVIRNCVTSGGASLVTGKPIILLDPRGTLSPTLTSASSIGQNTGLVSRVVGTSFVLASGTTTTVTLTGAMPTSAMQLTPIGLTAAALYALGTTAITAKNGNTVTITHPSGNAGVTFDLIATGGF